MKLRYLTLLALAFGSQASINDKLAQCAQLSDNGLRLACFDALAKQAKADPAMAATPASNESLRRPAVVAKTEDKAASFGMEQKVQRETQLEQLTAIVTKVDKNPYGKLVIVLDNGQIWKQSDSNYLSLKNGDKVVLDKGALGSIYLSTEGSNRNIRVSRSK
ncbi:hypothetical protein [Gallaecimonas xiamenensis]|uniref:Type IV pilus biogenesis protein PilP n=1 Tax=Gallaecimonas xiamenensis 3-C-1 TaxID=745411 RepID=K2KET1_9GAMM|nr:hypothetical protein [Gallaecimonas xiamenensis]EKE75860.1 hypothetical protein B3C1_05357 [Gallaecimonas xiamenensis 3-C-1]